MQNERESTANSESSFASRADARRRSSEKQEDEPDASLLQEDPEVKDLLEQAQGLDEARG